MRFHCADCGQPLKLSDNALRHIVAGFVEKANPGGTS
jgi:hypothetical protein